MFLSLKATESTGPAWIFLIFLFVSLIFAVLGLLWMIRVAKERKGFEKSFEAVGNQKVKYNSWTFVVALFICFTGIVGALVCAGIFFGSL